MQGSSRPAVPADQRRTQGPQYLPPGNGGIIRVSALQTQSVHELSSEPPASTQPRISITKTNEPAQAAPDSGSPSFVVEAPTPPR
ncbi:hypothetical protein FH972_014394 [Carpinus fangiana]|uniref:Uncharacterized protein n=1 Tax=Carpinus fangiana TaxID=176857 RepID=A0A5N6LG26_9ROSI|nr:hypothetical protein FH972_027286 [Carpinus fangiana]KAE8075701.1 hypothetical protein FH972_014394 [Carpinus fangiana]